ncbi:MAG TPA: hypothetical protein VJ183_14570 [Chloroflexia bacterium]|nr:hypothetical protein [Chloroflexia bacterium]
MKTQSSDTHPDAERVQIELLRKATVAQRFGLVRSLTKTTRQLAWRAIQRAYPDASDEEVALLFAAHAYGQELAERLRHDLARRRIR